MGLSERMLAESVWVCDQLNKNVLYTFPTQQHLQDFVQARLEPVLLNSDYFKSRIEGEAKSKELDKVGLKRIGKGHLYLRGSQNEKQIITIDADAIILDERDRFAEQNVAFIDKRMLASDLKWRREISTPTLPGIGIDAAYKESDQRVWQVECKKCHEWQEVDFFTNIDFEKKITVCLKCKEPIDRYADGRWYARNPSSDIHGYKINGMYNPHRDIPELILAYEKASTSGFSELQQFYNQTLGYPYDVTGQKLSGEVLNACKTNYLLPEKTEAGTYAGVDVGVKWLHTIVVRKTSEGKIRVVWAGTVKNFTGPVDSLEAIINTLNVKIMVVDKRPEVTKVNELIAMFPHKVYAAEYSNTKFTVQEYHKWDDIKRELVLDRTISLDYLIGDLQNQRIELPNNIEQVEDFYDHLLASIRITEKNKSTGVDVARWVEKGADHYFHTLNYARMASQRDVTGEALLNYYKEPVQMTSPSFIDWLRINGQRIN